MADVHASYITCDIVVYVSHISIQPICSLHQLGSTVQLSNSKNSTYISQLIRVSEAVIDGMSRPMGGS